MSLLLDLLGGPIVVNVVQQETFVSASTERELHRIAIEVMCDEEAHGQLSALLGSSSILLQDQNTNEETRWRQLPDGRCQGAIESAPRRATDCIAQREGGGFFLVIRRGISDKARAMSVFYFAAFEDSQFEYVLYLIEDRPEPF